ncbi:hypothetical protein BT96DRAFT_339398 [Gymnopus androsaceus JB14]|uniref:Uncharacterized protein n=1 Tax=Gymnopus androsaceus JB14 TaxID=1447944 RepID=A0A6A4I9G3_9AGAR|nr:hypothetical protein BT96DRAFT_339398 [Gymnopus androsaceus JB14]
MALRPQSPPSLPALDAYTALFSTYINQQRDEVTASYQAKLAEVEAGLKAAQDEAASLRDSNSSHAAPTLLDLQQQLQAARNQVEAGERAYKQVYEGSENLVAYYRSSNAESQQVAQREKQSVQAELDALRVEHQALQQDRLNERAAQGAAKREVESLKRKTAELEKSLTEAKSAEEFLKRVVLEMRNTDAGLVKQLENGKTEREKVETELRNRLEVVTSESAKHKAEAEEVSAKLEESMPHFRRLLQEIERLKQEGRESSSVITALQHQVNGASLASHQEVARLQDQLSVLRSQQSQSQAALTESVQKVEMYEQEVSKLREALTRAEATTQTVQADRDAAISRVEDLSLQLSAAQEEGTREKENLGNRMLLLASTLRHHDLAILDVDSHALAPSPKLVSLWEKLQELVSEFETPSSLHFPFVLTEHNNAVASIFSALVDQLARFGDRSQHRQEALDERELLEGKLETTADGLFTAISSPAPPCSVDESHNSQPESISESESESESQMLDTSTLPVASSKEGRKPVSVPPALSPESSTPSTTLMSDHPSSASPISVTDADETVIVAAPKSPRGRPKKPVVASKAAPSKSSTVSLVLPGIDLSSSSADTPEPIPATHGRSETFARGSGCS